MNTKQFLTLFFGIALIGMANAIWFGTTGTAAAGTAGTVLLNGALTVPLAAGTVGTFALPLAVLGALKLGAVALLALGYLGNNNNDDGYSESGYGYSGYEGHRHRRSAGLHAPNEDAVFALVSSMDSYGCGKQLICELEAKNEKELAEDEAILLRLFR